MSPGTPRVTPAVALTLAELLKVPCPSHGKSCGTMVDPGAVWVNGLPGRRVEVLCAYRLNAAFGILGASR